MISIDNGPANVEQDNAKAKNNQAPAIPFKSSSTYLSPALDTQAQSVRLSRSQRVA